MAYLTLLDMAKRTGDNREIGLIEDVVTYAPELAVLPVRPIQGVNFKTGLRTGYPTGSFRKAGAGTPPVKSTYQQKFTECFYYDAQMTVDEALPEAEDRSVGDILTDEADAAVAGAGIYIGAQFYYGTNQDANGFQGIQSYITGNANFEVNAGVTAGAANTTSAYLVYMGIKGVHLAAGRTAGASDGIGDPNLPAGEPAVIAPPFTMMPWNRQQVADPNNPGRFFFAYVSNIRGWIGLAYGSSNSVFRVRNVMTAPTIASKANVFTDTLAAQLLALVPLHIRASGQLRWFLNPTAALGLQLSRSYTSITNATPGMKAAAATGDQIAGPIPEECMGIEIILTNSITNTETGI